MSKHLTYMNMVEEYSNFSKCQFTKVGALAINENGRVIATGVNGTIPGSTNCCDIVFNKREDHIDFTIQNEIHAEANLILELATSSITFNELSIYLTISPCPECFKLLLGLNRQYTKVKYIIFKEKYHRVPNKQLLEMKQKASQYSVQLLSLDEAIEKENNEL